MNSFATVLLTLSVGTWVGAIVFQSAVVAPAVFAGLDEPDARSFLRTIFPRFYRLGLVCGAFMLAGLAGSVAVHGWTSVIVVLAIGVLSFVAVSAATGV